MAETRQMILMASALLQTCNCPKLRELATSLTWAVHAKAPCTFALDGLNPDQFNAQSYTIILRKGSNLESARVLKEDQSLVPYKMFVLNEGKKKVKGFSKHIWCSLHKVGEKRRKTVIKKAQIGSFSKLIKKMTPGKYNVDFTLIAEKVWKSPKKSHFWSIETDHF